MVSMATWRFDFNHLKKKSCPLIQVKGPSGNCTVWLVSLEPTMTHFLARLKGSSLLPVYFFEHNESQGFTLSSPQEAATNPRRTGKWDLDEIVAGERIAEPRRWVGKTGGG